MIVNFALAGDHAQIVHALCIIESNENPDAVGDGGRARGLIQQHPSFFVQWYVRSVSVADTWEQAYIKAAKNFFDRYLDDFGLDGAISAYNTGAVAYAHGTRNDEYVARFHAAYQSLQDGSHQCKLAA